MNTVTLQVSTLDEVQRRARDAFKTKKQGAYISFATPELLFRLLTVKAGNSSARSPASVP